MELSTSSERDQKIKEHQSEYERYRRQQKKRKGGRGRRAGRAKLKPVERTSEMMVREMQVEINPKVEHIPVAAPVPIPEPQPMVWKKTKYKPQSKLHSCNRCGCKIINKPTHTKFCTLCLPVHVREKRRARDRIRRLQGTGHRRERRESYQKIYRQSHKKERTELYHNQSEYQKLRKREHSRRELERRTNVRRWLLAFTNNHHKIRKTNDISQCRNKKTYKQKSQVKTCGSRQTQLEKTIRKGPQGNRQNLCNNSS